MSATLVGVASSGECLRSGSCGWQVKLCDPPISERFRDEVHDEALYTLTFVTFLLLLTTCEQGRQLT